MRAVKEGALISAKRRKILAPLRYAYSLHG
jgi:hypothetical protein